jgi:hypothetical protein
MGKSANYFKLQGKYMKKLLVLVMGMFLFCAGSEGGEWGPYVYQAPIMVQTPAVQYVPYTYYVPSTVMVPVTPVVSYQNVVVEHRCWCLFKKQEVIPVPRIIYVPVNQGPYRY